MYDKYNNDHLQYVSISGQAPDIQLTLLDCSGKAETFTISEMLFYGYKKEEDRSKQERDVVYYKGKILLRNYPGVVTRTRMFKYFPDGEKWYICGDVEELLQWKRL